GLIFVRLNALGTTVMGTAVMGTAVMGTAGIGTAHLALRLKPRASQRVRSMADDSTRASPSEDPERKLESELPREEREQPDPALQLSTGRLGAAGWVIFAVIGIFVLTVVLWGLNGPNETPSPSGPAASTNAAAPNTSSGPTPTAPANGPGNKP